MLAEEARFRAVNAAETGVRRWRTAWDLAFTGMFFYWYFGLIFGTPSTTSGAAPIVFLVWWSALIAVWMFRARPEWKGETPRILLFLIPLEIFLVILFFSPHRGWAVPTFVIAGAGLSLVSLRLAPWASARWIAMFVLPFTLGGAALYLHALERGDGWTEFDRWTGDAWKAMLGGEARLLGLAMAGVALGFTGMAFASAWWFARSVGRKGGSDVTKLGGTRTSDAERENEISTDSC